MRRLAIIVCYDFESKCDEYLRYLIKNTKLIAEELIVVTNGSLDIRCSIEKTKIIQRNNIGYDGGAYKDILLEIGRKKIMKYDELVLMNDSFYGPLCEWTTVFNNMSNIKADYWGLTRSIQVYCEKDVEISHIQGYFIVLRNRILKDDGFIDFWRELEYPETYDDAIKNYEYGINDWLQQKGYVGTSYMEQMGGENLIQTNVNPYIKYPVELIKEYKVPVLKRKAINSNNWVKIKKLFNELIEDGYYDVNLIWENWRRYDLNKKIESYSISDIVDFCDKHPRLYVYGKGYYGKQKMEILTKLGYENAEYIVTKKDDEEVKEISDISFSESDGIIIGVGPKYFDEVYKAALSLVGADNILSI